MWRAFFLAVGTFLLLLGAQCLGVEKFILKSRERTNAVQLNIFAQNPPQVGSSKSVDPPPWAPWSLISTGTVVCLYSFSIPRRMNNG